MSRICRVQDLGIRVQCLGFDLLSFGNSSLFLRIVTLVPTSNGALHQRFEGWSRDPTLKPLNFRLYNSNP